MTLCSVCGGDHWTNVDGKRHPCPRCIELARGLRLNDARLQLHKIIQAGKEKQNAPAS